MGVSYLGLLNTNSYKERQKRNLPFFALQALFPEQHAATLL